MEESKEVLESLKDFVKQEQKVVTSELEDVIKNVAKTGKYVYPWDNLKPLFLHQLEQVTKTFLDSSPPKISDEIDSEKLKELENLRQTIVESFGKFNSAPFTIQRLSELLVDPKKHYRTPAKFFRGLEKNVLVVSTVDPEDGDERPSKRLKLDSIPETERNGQLDDTLPLSEEESDTPADDTKPANNENSQISNTNKEESDTNTEKSNDSIQSMTDTSPSPSTTPETTTAEKINDEKSPSLSTDGEDVLEPLSLEKSDEPEQPNEESVQEQKDEKIAEEKVERTDHNITSESEGPKDTTPEEPMDQS